MFHLPLKVKQPTPALRRLLVALLTSTLIGPYCCQPAQAQVMAYCQLPAAAAQEKESLLQATIKGSKEADERYKELLTQHSEQVRQCRSRNWPRNEAIWLRLYPCDVRTGVLDYVMDHIVDRGYNQVYVEVFHDGQVLLPASANPTAWPSVLRIPGFESTDLLAQAIQKGHERGLKVYAWMFTMNFGYSYSQRSDRQSVLARDGKGETSQAVVEDGSQTFVDPYNLQAKRDYYQLVQEIVRRQPDGVLFDYVRYPRQSGSSSVATKVQDLWVYSNAAQQALYKRALNYKGLALIRRFLSQGYISVEDVASVDKLYPQEGEPMWQGRTLPPPSPDQPLLTAAERQPLLQWELWQLSVAHALQGILDFLAVGNWPVRQQGIPSGVAFFPEGNQAVRQGYDSRLQPWDRFPSSMEWHPMSYANCGDTSCIVSQVQRVLKYAPPGTQVAPILAGDWGRSLNNRPPLEVQMQAIHEAAPQINQVSHFAFSWQEPEFDRTRKYCRLQ